MLRGQPLSAVHATRASTIAAVVGFLTLTSLGALVLAILVSSLLARRFTAPLRRLTEAARALAEGDLDPSRGRPDRARTGADRDHRIVAPVHAMAAQVQETMDVIVRARATAAAEFLADVSHELRTPAGGAPHLQRTAPGKGRRGRGRSEPNSWSPSAQQIERLDWLAQNLLELSKLDSGLVRLDLRPDDLRATVLSAVEQAEAAAHRPRRLPHDRVAGGDNHGPPRPAADRPDGEQPGR